MPKIRPSCPSKFNHQVVELMPTGETRELTAAIKHVLGDDDELVDQIFEIVKNQHEY